MKLITMVEVVIMEAVGMVTPNPNTKVDTDKDIRLNMVEVDFYFNCFCMYFIS